MAKLITSMDDVDGAIECLDVGATGDYLSLLEDYRVTSGNMEFDNEGVPTAATLLILESRMSGSCYTLAYATNMDDGIRRYLDMQLEKVLRKRYLELGGGSVDTSGNISLNLAGATTINRLSFASPKIVQITDSSGNDEIYIDSSKGSNGVSDTATLDFSRGNDTIKFNGPTTVNTIRGG